MDNEIITVAGKKVTILPVARILTEQIRLGVVKEYQERGEVLDIPTYLVPTGDGSDIQEFPHDEVSIKEAPQADRDKWVVYKDTQARLDRDVSGKVTRFMLYKGIVVDKDEMEKALQFQADFGISLPEDIVDRTVYYITTELLPTTYDIIHATQAIILLSMSGVEEETLRAVEASFRSALEKAGRGAVGRLENAEG